MARAGCRGFGFLRPERPDLKLPTERLVRLHGEEFEEEVQKVGRDAVKGEACEAGKLAEEGKRADMGVEGAEVEGLEGRRRDATARHRRVPRGTVLLAG